MHGQCRVKSGFLGRNTQCQGVIGHEGMHWFYGPDGWLNRWPKKSMKSLIGFEMTPPGHQRYISPEKMQDKHYMTDWIARQRAKRKK